MSYAADQVYRRLLFYVVLVVFPIVLVVYAFSGCDVRERSTKKACSDGAAEQCLSVGRFYEGKSDGIAGFAMSNAATAATYYDLGCKHGSSVACERLGHIMFAGASSAKDYGCTYEQAVDALARACVDRVSGACSELDDSFHHTFGGRMAEARAARFFLDACKSGTAEGCYQFGRFMTVPHGDEPADLGLAKKYFTKACEHGHAEGCARSK